MSQSLKGRIIIAVNATVIAVVLLASLVVPRGETVVVIAPPWSDAGEPLRIVAGAGGTFVSNGRFPWIAVAHSNAADFTSRLFRNGAWLVLDPALAAGCLAGKA